MKSLFIICLCLAMPFSCFSTFHAESEKINYFLDAKTLITMDQLKKTRDSTEKKILKTNLKIEFLNILDGLKKDIEDCEKLISGGHESINIGMAMSQSQFEQYYNYLLDRIEQNKSKYKEVEAMMNDVLNSR